MLTCPLTAHGGRSHVSSTAPPPDAIQHDCQEREHVALPWAPHSAGSLPRNEEIEAASTKGKSNGGRQKPNPISAYVELLHASRCNIHPKPMACHTRPQGKPKNSTVISEKIIRTRKEGLKDNLQAAFKRLRLTERRRILSPSHPRPANTRERTYNSGYQKITQALTCSSPDE